MTLESHFPRYFSSSKVIFPKKIIIFIAYFIFYLRKTTSSVLEMRCRKGIWSAPHTYKNECSSVTWNGGCIEMSNIEQVLSSRIIDNVQYLSSSRVPTRNPTILEISYRIIFKMNMFKILFMSAFNLVSRYQILTRFTFPPFNVSNA